MTVASGPLAEGIVNTLISIGCIALITPLVVKSQSRELALREARDHLQAEVENARSKPSFLTRRMTRFSFAIGTVAYCTGIVARRNSTAGLRKRRWVRTLGRFSKRFLPCRSRKSKRWFAYRALGGRACPHSARRNSGNSRQSLVTPKSIDIRVGSSCGTVCQMAGKPNRTRERAAGFGGAALAAPWVFVGVLRIVD